MLQKYEMVKSTTVATICSILLVKTNAYYCSNLLYARVEKTVRTKNSS